MQRFVLLIVLTLVMATVAGCVAKTADEPLAPEEPDPEPSKAPTSGVIHRTTKQAENATGAPVGNATGTTNDTADALPVGTGRYTGFTTFEPTIGVTSSGAIFVTSYGGTGWGTHIIRSTDKGATWDNVGPFLPVLNSGPGQFPNSNDPFLYVDPWTDRIVKFDMHALTTQTFEYSDDDGATWSIATPAAGFPPALQDHQSLTSAPPTNIETRGYDNVFMYCVNRGPYATGAWCSSSFDGGLTWTPLVPGFPVGKPQCAGLHGHPVGDNEGRFYRGNPSCGGVAVYRSEDSGLTWTQHEVSTTKALNHEVAVAVDEADNVYAFWIGADGLPYFSASFDKGETWSEADMVAPPGVTATDFPTIVGGGDGQVAFAYVGTTHPDGYETYDDEDETATMTWNGYIGLIHDTREDALEVATVTANDPADPLFVGMCGGIRCGGFGDFIDIAIDPEGRPWAAFGDSCHDKCLKDQTNDDRDLMFIGTLESGRSLRGTGLLSILPPVADATSADTA